MVLHAREAALTILNSFEKALKASKGLESIPSRIDELASKVNKKDRPLYTMLVKGIFRKKEKIDSVIKDFSNRKTNRLDFSVLNALRIGIFEIIYLTNIPEYASLNETVNLAGSFNKKSKPFVNAILRNILRDRARIPLIPHIKNTLDCIKFSLSYPDWMAEMFCEYFGKEKALRYAESLNEEEVTSLRVNRLKTKPDKLINDFVENRIKARKSLYSNDCILLESKIDLANCKEYIDGHFYFQNASSQIAVKILNPKSGEIILDTCASPGGKSTYIQETTKNESKLYSNDLNEKKIKKIKDNIKRLSLENVETTTCDSSKPSKTFKDKGLIFDKILVDAPCSALGTIRKNPEIKWIKAPKDVKRLSRLQKSILNNQAANLKTKGTLLYSVCTFTRAETFEVVEDFLKRSGSFSILPIKENEIGKLGNYLTEEGFLTIPPVSNELEPFFMARFVKDKD